MVKDQYGSLDGREIFQKLKEGDPVMKEIVDLWISNIADGLVSLTHIFNPEIILLGGGVSAQKELFIDKVRKKVLERVMPRFADGLIIDAAALSNDAGMIGAIRPLLLETKLGTGYF